MAYNPNIPQPSHRLRISQSEMLENFSKLDSLFDYDHVKFSDLTGDAGKHEASTYVNRTDKVLTIPPVTTSEELAIYVKDDAAGTPRIFYQEPDSAGAGAEQQLSGKVTASTSGECPLIGGMGLKWGKVTLVGINIPLVVTYAGLGLSDFLVSTYAVFITDTLGVTGFPSANVFDKTKFIANTSGLGRDVYFMAIGK